MVVRNRCECCVFVATVARDQESLGYLVTERKVLYSFSHKWKARVEGRFFHWEGSFRSATI
jgi:hypothetical protein